VVGLDDSRSSTDRPHSYNGYYSQPSPSVGYHRVPRVPQRSNLLLQSGATIIHEYEHSCDDLLAAIGSVRGWLSEPRYVHPWFGPLSAAGWRTLAAGHLHIHRGQIERIIAGLPMRGATARTNGNRASASPAGVIGDTARE
jgi:hypothetical protein